MYYNNNIHLLCKFSTINGDITVRYNTSNEAFFSPFDWIGGYADELHKTLKQIALWLYAAYVCPDEEQGILPTEEAYHLFTDDIKAELSFSSICGKARTTLSKGSDKHWEFCVRGLHEPNKHNYPRQRDKHWIGRVRRLDILTDHIHKRQK